MRVHNSVASGTAASIVSGFGAVHRYGDAWTGMSGTTDRALVLGAGLQHRDAATRIRFTIDVEDYVTHAGYTHTTKQKRPERVSAPVFCCRVNELL